VPSTILFNGNVVADGAAVQEIFVKQMPPARFEVQSFDCQVINRDYPTATAAGLKPPTQKTVKDMSLLVTVSGYVQFGASRDTPQRGFSETFVLVPNSAAGPAGAGAKGKGKKEWLIQTQNFRLVV
jgi:NTF2-related export protein 1/2